jgi:predicted acetyltransferase
MAVEVLPCTGIDELADALAVIGQFFGMSRDLDNADRFTNWLDMGRMHAAWEDGRIIGGAGAFGFDVSVPGGARVPGAGVTVVAVQPTHRRRGVLTAMMREQLDDIHRRGEPLAYLWASESTIYGRFGYGLASQASTMSLPHEYTAFADEFEARGEVCYVEQAEALELFPPIYERVRDVRPGMFSRTRSWWELRRLGDDPAHRGNLVGPLRLALLTIDGEPAGYATYRVAPAINAGISSSRVMVREVMGVSPEAEREIWRFVLDIDWVAAIEYEYLAPDSALVLLLAEPRRLKQTLWDGVWVRLVDVGEALAARSLEDGAPVVLQLEDAFCPWNAGNWRVSSDEIERTDDPADLKLDVSSLGSVYLGGFTFGDLVRASRATELTPGATRHADALFRTDPGPWCPEVF